MVKSRGTTSLVRFGSFSVLLWLLACGGGNPAGTDRPVRRTEIAVEEAPPGLQQAVLLDSSRWQPSAFIPDPGGELEIEGTYFLRFRSQADQALDLRCELRFFDADGFLLDVFIPFGQPLHLAPRRTLDSAGEFSIRLSGTAEEVEPVLMRVALRLSPAE